MPLATIIGVGPGISYAVAEKFGQEGFRIALIGRNGEKLKTYVEKLREKGVEAMYAVGDVSSATSLLGAMEKIREKAGNSDMILYNPSSVDVQDVLEQDWEIMERTFQVNVGGAFHLLKAELPRCLKENKGKLFFTGGGFALSGDPQWTTLSVGKAALRNMLQAFVKRVAGTHVHIAHLIVCGYVHDGDEKYNAATIADIYWKLYQQQPGAYETELIY